MLQLDPNVQHLLERLKQKSWIAALRLFVNIALFVIALLVLGFGLRPLFSTPAPKPLVAKRDALSFGMTLEQRKQAFARLARVHSRYRRRARRRFGTHPYTAERAYHQYVRTLVRDLARQTRLNVSQIWLAIDEGIRLRWPDRYGKPLPATSVPLDPKSSW